VVAKAVTVGGETVTAPLNIDQALDARDAIAKALYSSLFTWMVTRLNKICSPSKPGHHHKPARNDAIRQFLTLNKFTNSFYCADY
jgi:myosin heavy subunit